MTQKEEKVDSVQQEPTEKTTFEDLKIEYTKLAIHQYRLRNALTEDFKHFKKQLVLAREVERSRSIHIMNELIEYIDRTVPILEMKTAQFREELGPLANVVDSAERGPEGVTGEKRRVPSSGHLLM